MSIALPPLPAARPDDGPLRSPFIALTGPLHPAAVNMAPTPEALHATVVAGLETVAPVADQGLATQFGGLEWHGAAWALQTGAPRFHPRVPLAANGPAHASIGRTPGVADGEEVLPVERWEALVAEAPLPLWREDGELRLLGPVRAAPACLACHVWRVGALVGAYEYRFTEIDDD